MSSQKQSFHVGYCELHPDRELNFEMNRFSTGGEDMIAEMRAVASRIHDYADYTREFLALSDQALARGDTLKGAYYLRSAEFYMFSGDPRKEASRRKFVQLMREHFGMKTNEHFDVPYQGTTLPVYRTTPQHPKGAVVLFGGFDSYNEDRIPMQLYLNDASFDVINFEGPGQGAVLEDAHLPMTHEWEKPVKAVLDYFKLEDVTLMGTSLGGCLVTRAAAYEPRVHRVIADDILTDFYDVLTRQFSDSVRSELLLKLKDEEAEDVNTMIEGGMKKSLTAEWGIKQGMHVTGTKTPYEFLKQTQLYRTDDVSPLVGQDVLLMAGSEDHFVPLHQFYDQIRSLNHVRSLTARLFTKEEQAQNHTQVGNVGLSLQVIASWIDGTVNKYKYIAP